MPDLSSKIYPRIKSHQFDSLPLEDGMLLPFYDGLSLVNIPGAVTHLLDVPPFGKPALDHAILSQLGGPYEKVILLLSDALGYHQLDRMMQSDANLVWAKYADRAVFSMLTSVCPSTTASALTTLWTGEGPAAHGIIGYEMWAKEFGMVINNIRHSPASARSGAGELAKSGFDPHAFLDMPLLGVHLRENGVIPTTFIHSSIAHSGLSVMQMEDVDVQTYVDEADLSVSLAEFVDSRHGIREYIYVYYSDVDTLMHRYNAENQRVSLQFKAFSAMFEEAFINGLSEAVANDTLLILTADHGSIATAKHPRYDLANVPELLDCLVMQPTCENRLAFLYIKPGKVQMVKDIIERTWPEEFVLMPPEVALESGLFGKGPFKPNVLERLGDLVVIARGDAYLWWAPKPNPLEGRHGGLSEGEMLVPFYALPLSRLFEQRI